MDGTPEELRLAIEFDAPALRAQLDALMALGRAVRVHLPCLQAASRSAEGPNWDDIVDRLAAVVGADLADLSVPAGALNLWNQFANKLANTHLAQAQQQALNDMRLELESLLRVPASLVEMLIEANQRAHVAVSALLAQRGADGLLPPLPRRIFLHADLDAKGSCSATAVAVDYVAWAFQRAPRALWAVMSAEHVFQHEYLSHVAPRSEHLSRIIRETWLVFVLFESHRNTINDPLRYERDSLVWRHFRAALDEPPGIRVAGDALEACAGRLFGRYPEHFWGLTAEMLRIHFNERSGRRLDRLVRQLVRLSDTALAAVLGVQWQSHAHLLARIDSKIL